MIMATPFTLKNNKFKNLIDSLEKVLILKPIPCDGLVEFIEKGKWVSEELKVLKMRLKKYENEIVYAAIVLDTLIILMEEAILREFLDKEYPYKFIGDEG